MNSTKNPSTKRTRRPRIKWGALALSIALASIELALILLNMYAHTGKLAGANLVIGFWAAYGWLFGAFCLLLPAWGYLSEDFLPSYKKYKSWERRKHK